MTVTLRPITASDIPQAKQLFLTAFPPEERPPFWLFKRKSYLPCSDWLSIIHDDTWIGFFYLITNEDIAYLFFFAIQDEFRGKGYGSLALTELKKRYSGKRLFLAIEPPDDPCENHDQRIKRKAFYIRNGFEDLSQKVQEGNVVYDLLGIGGKILAREYESLVKKWAGWIFYIWVTIKMVKE